MKLIILTLLVLTTCACDTDKVSAKEPSPSERVEELHTEWLWMQARAAELADPATGWIAPNDCDGMITEGQRGMGSVPDPFTVDNAEYADQPGRFGRRPSPCWTEEQGDIGAQTTWSRDMAICGLFPYTWVHRRLDLIQRHARWCEDHPLLFDGFPSCKMGEPLADGRAVYTPAIVGVMYQIIHALDGGDNANRLWPNVYPPGLDGYQAHLQVCDIWVRGDVAGAASDWPNVPAPPRLAVSVSDVVAAGTQEHAVYIAAVVDDDISGTMYNRLREHAEREPRNPFYWAVYGKYNGNLMPAIDLLLAADKPSGSYLCDLEACQLAQRMAAAFIVLKQFRRI